MKRLRFDPARVPSPLFAFVLACALCAGCDQPIETVALRVNHRIYPAFGEVHRVAPGESFVIGDTDYFARVVGFVPDFAIDDRTKKVISRTNEPRNPAVRVAVFQADKKVDEVWAFRGEGPPHFGAKSMIAFRIEELVFKPGYAAPSPVPATDSTATADTTAPARADPADSSGKR